VNARNAAFTLIELMVAVAILGLSMTIVFLKVDTLLPGSRLEASCKRIVTDIELLRSQSIFSGHPIYFEYDIGGNGYRAYYPLIFDDDNMVVGAGETEIFEPVWMAETVEIEKVALGFFDGERGDAGKETIIIRPDGSLTGHIVQVKNTETGDVMSVRIASLTGFAEIIAGSVEYAEVGDASF